LKVCIRGSRGSLPTPLSSDEVAEKIADVLWGVQGLTFSGREEVEEYLKTLPLLERGTVSGNTSCVEVQHPGDPVILDAGSGIRPLGQRLMEGPCGQGKGTIHLLMNHTHWDHVNGFPFFAPAYVPGNRIIIYGVHEKLRERFDIQQNPLHFPVPLSAMPAEMIFKNIKEGETYEVGDLRFRTKCLVHPGESYAYRIEDDSGSFVYATDCEYKNLGKPAMEPFLEFYRNADILIFDAQYTFQEALLKEDWGHSSSLIGVDIAVQAGVKQLLMFHHDPAYDDKKIGDLLEKTRRYLKHTHHDANCVVNLAFEGMCYDPAEEPVEIRF